MNKIKIKDKVFTTELVEINIAELKFNPYNTRIHTIGSKIIEKINENPEKELEILLSSKIQDEIYNKFIEKYLGVKEYKELEKSIIKSNGLIREKPIYITQNNLVLSGNTRLSILKKLLNQGKHKINVTVMAYKINEDVENKASIDLLENYIQYYGEQRVEYDTFSKWMKKHSAFHQDKISLDELAERYDEKASEISTHIEIINNYYKILHSLGNNDYIDLYQELSMSSVLQYISKELNGKNTAAIRSAIKELLINSILTSVPFNKIRTVMNTYLGIKNSDYKNEDKLNSIKELNANMLSMTEGLAEKTRAMIINGEKIKENKERMDMLSKIEPSLIVSKLQDEATKVKSSYDDNEEQFIKETIADFRRIVNRVNKRTTRYASELEEIEEKLVKLLN